METERRNRQALLGAAFGTLRFRCEVMVHGLVTVIVPCFNCAHYLRKCIESLIDQAYTQWECIIVDDGSTDDTRAISAALAATDTRIRIIRQTNKGVSAARNAGLAAAEGEFIQFLDADDLLQSKKLAIHVDFLQEHPAVDVVSGDAAYVDESGRGSPREWNAGRVEGDGVAALPFLIGENPLMIHSPLVRSRIFEYTGMFKENMRGNEDWEFWLRCAFRGCRFAYASTRGEGLALVRRHDARTSAARPMMLDTAMALREVVHPILPPDLRQKNLEGLAKLKARRGVDLIRAGQVSAGWHIYTAGLRLTQHRMTYMLQLLRLVPGVQYTLSALRSWNLSR